MVLEMTAPDECDCSGNDEPKCPYCGHEQSDFWETSKNTEGDGYHDCDSCSRRFSWSCMVSITYRTTPIVGPYEVG